MLAHTLKGVSANIGAKKLSSLLGDIVNMLNSDGVDEQLLDTEGKTNWALSWMS